MLARTFYRGARVAAAVLLAAACSLTTAAAAEPEPPAGPGVGHEDHGAGHHDPYDLSHGDATAMLDNPIEWRFDMAVASFAVFITLLGLLSYVAWRPIMEGLDKRENSIAMRIADAQRSADEAAAQLRQYQAQLAQAAEEARAIVVQARKSAEAMADKIRQDAHQDADRERQRALADIQAAKQAAVREVSQRGADMAVLLAGRILRRELQPQDHASLIGDALENLPSRN